MVQKANQILTKGKVSAILQRAQQKKAKMSGKAQGPAGEERLQACREQRAQNQIIQEIIER